MQEPSSDEEWRDVPGYEGAYQVSDHGNVRSLDRWTVDKLDRRRWRPGVVLQHVYSNGYHAVALSSYPHKVHQLVALAFHGGKPGDAGDRFEVRHLDGDKNNNHVSNLAWGTSAENSADMKEHDTVYQRHKRTCPHGHLLAEPNLVAASMRRGKRACLACCRGAGTRHAARRHGIELDVRQEADRHYALIMSGEATPRVAALNRNKKKPLPEAS